MSSAFTHLLSRQRLVLTILVLTELGLKPRFAGASHSGLGTGSGGKVLPLDVALGLVLGRVEVGRVGRAGVRGLLVGLGLGLAHHLLRLGRVLADGALGDFAGAVRVLGGEVADLGRLLGDDVAGVVQVVVDQVFVLEVDQGSKVDDGREDQEDAPGWGELDEEVGEECGGECLRRVSLT